MARASAFQAEVVSESVSLQPTASICPWLSRRRAHGKDEVTGSIPVGAPHHQVQTLLSAVQAGFNWGPCFTEIFAHGFPQRFGGDKVGRRQQT